MKEKIEIPTPKEREKDFEQKYEILRERAKDGMDAWIMCISDSKGMSCGVNGNHTDIVKLVAGMISSCIPEETRDRFMFELDIYVAAYKKSKKFKERR